MAHASSGSGNPMWPSTDGKFAGGLLPESLLEAIPDAVVAVDQDGAILQVNSRAEALFQYEKQALIGRPVELLVPVSHRPDHEGHRRHYTESPKTRPMGPHLQLSARRRDGSEFPVDISLTPVETEEGTLILSAIRDISERKRVEAELRRVQEELHQKTVEQLGESRSRLASIIESSHDAILSKDLNGIITSWNQGAERIYGYTAAEIVGEPISRLVPPDRADEVPRLLDVLRNGGRVDAYESVRMTKDGRHINVSVSISPIADASGRIIGASSIARDITAQKKSEDHLRQAQRMESIGRLAGGIAHDFNNILGIIIASTELLRDRLDPASEAELYVDNIRKTADRGAALTRQLLVFSRKPVAKLEIVDLNQRIKEAIKLLRPLMGEDVETTVVARAQSALVEIDPSQLDQVIVNLAVNSRDAMPHGGRLVLETGNVEIDESFADQRHRPMVPGKYVLLAVSDTGVGMDEATRARVFEPFFTTKEIGKGTGLGLATAYGIIKQSGGHIWVYSEVGQGTTFKIYLPSAEHKIGLASRPQSEKVLPKAQGVTILVVEDDETLCQLTRQTLVNHGYTVMTATDGKSALEKLAASDGQVNLVLTDVVMRGMSGPELVGRLQESYPRVKVVYMSGYTGELMLVHDGLRHNAAFLEKPFTRTTLLSTIQEILG